MKLGDSKEALLRDEETVGRTRRAYRRHITSALQGREMTGWRDRFMQDRSGRCGRAIGR
jgi:hypothetical protein